VTLTNEVQDGGGSGGAEFVVGRDFVSGKTISVINRILENADIVVTRNLAGSIVVTNGNTSTNGLRGQVIANAGNTGGTWTGSASTGGTSLASIPYYTTVLDPLGGGAVGLVPYRIHQNASNVLVGN
jgi:hypothetical protein